MRRIYYILLSVLLSTSIISCNYLDIVPDELPRFEDAFATPQSAVNFLYSAYAFIPNPRSNAAVDAWTGDEVVMPFEHELWARFSHGNITAVSPGISYWNTLFAGIRQVWMFYHGVPNTPGLSPAAIVDMQAQAQFLLGYYHWLLLRKYGPIIIIRDPSLQDVNLLNTPDRMPGRTPYHESVEWIVERLNYAIERLPTSRPTGQEGLVTRQAAKAIKARMLLYAASPLFNSTENARLFSGFRNYDGAVMIPSEFDPQRWVRAREAARAAIDAAHAAGHRLFVASDAVSPAPVPADPVQRALRFVTTERTSPENIWIDARHEDFWARTKSFPRHHGGAWNGMAPTIRMLDRFLTENGLPIDYDPAFDYNGRFAVDEFPAGSINGEGQTLRMNLGREPRFYSWISFHGGFFEVRGLYDPALPANDLMNSGWAPDRLRKDGWAILTTYLRDDPQGAGNLSNDFSPSGFLNKKGTHPETNMTTWALGHVHFPFPVVRLAELYLNFAEAAIETGQLAEAKVYINRVRTRAGIPTVEDAWGSIGEPLNQGRLREIVRRERLIELYLEHHNFWDIRRWMLAERYFANPPSGLNVRATNLSDFGVVTPLDGRPIPGGTAFNARRNFIAAHYLMPIPSAQVNNNPNVVQNPGY